MLIMLLKEALRWCLSGRFLKDIEFIKYNLAKLKIVLYYMSSDLNHFKKPLILHGLLRWWTFICLASVKSLHIGKTTNDNRFPLYSIFTWMVCGSTFGSNHLMLGMIGAIFYFTMHDLIYVSVSWTALKLLLGDMLTQSIFVLPIFLISL